MLGPSMRNIGLNAGLLSEDNETIRREAINNVVESNDFERFAMPREPTKAANRRDQPFKSSLFSHNLEMPETYEDLGNVEFESRGVEDFNGPSTSALFQRRQFTNNVRDVNASSGAGPIRGRECNRLFRPLSREGISHSRLQHQINDSNYASHENRVSSSGKFGFGMKNSGLSIHRTFSDKSRLIHDERSSVCNEDFMEAKRYGFQLRNHPLERESSLRNMTKSETNLPFQSKTAFPRMFDYGSRNPELENCSFRKEGLRSRQNSVTGLGIANSQIGMPTTLSRNFSSESRNTVVYQEDAVQDKVKFNEKLNNDNHSFVRPSISRIIRPRNSTMSSHLFSHNNFEPNNRRIQYNKDLSSASRFNITHISRRDTETFSDSRYYSNLRQNPLDNQSIADSIVSVASVKAELRDFVEYLHHSVLNMAPNLPVEFVGQQFDRARKMLENIKEISFVPTVREMDAASISSHVSQRNAYSAVSKTESKNNFNCQISLRSGKEILKTLIKNKEDCKSRRISSIEEERKTSCSKGEIQNSYEEKEDSALLFKKPKPFARTGKKDLNLIKQPKHEKNTKRVINLKHWYPVAGEVHLTFCGIIKNGTPIQTEAVRKRVSNRTVELINGSECNLIGSPAKNKISDFSIPIKTKLNDGLPFSWRKFHAQLLVDQKSIDRIDSKSTIVEKKPSEKPKNMDPEKERKTREEDRTPTTRKGKFRSGKSSEMKSRISIIPATRKIQFKPKFDRNSPKSNGAGKMEKTDSLEMIEKKKKKTKKKSPSREKTPGKMNPQTVDSGSRTRSGKTVKPPMELTVSGKNEGRNSNRGAGKITGKGVKVHSSGQEQEKETEGEEEDEEEEKNESKTPKTIKTKKRKIAADLDLTQKKKTKTEKSTLSDSMVENKISAEYKKHILNELSGCKNSEKSKNKRKNKKSLDSSNATDLGKSATGKSGAESKEEFHFQLDDIIIPEMANVSGKLHLNRSQLRIVSTETPPLKYFNTKSITPIQSPNWCIAQRTESEVKQFQKRRAICHKKKVTTEKKETTMKTTKIQAKNKDLKNAFDWVKDKLVRTPIRGSKVLNYMIPSRRKMVSEIEEEEEEEEEEEDDSENKSCIE